MARRAPVRTSQPLSRVPPMCTAHHGAHVVGVLTVRLVPLVRAARPLAAPANKSLEPTAVNVAKIICSMLFRLRPSLVLVSLAAAHLSRSPAFAAPRRMRCDLHLRT